MPVVKRSSAIYRPDLGFMIMEFVEGITMGFIGLQVMPLFPVTEQSATFLVIPKEALLGLPDVSRTPRGHYQRGDWEAERGLYATTEQGWEEPVDDVERSLIDQETPGVADFIATRRAWNHIMRAQEKRIADMVFDDSTWTDHTISNAWDVAASATPIDDINDGKLSMRKASGLLPDTLIISYPTFIDLKNCDQVVNRLKYTFPGIDINRITSEQLAAIFDVPQVLVGGAVYSSAGKGLDAVIADLWDDEFAALIKISRGRDMMEPGFGRTFLWTEDSPSNPIVEQYREEDIRSDVFRVRHHVDERLIRSLTDAGATKSDIAAACIYLMSPVTTD